MGEGSIRRSPARWIAGLAAIVVLWWIGFEQDERIPVLTYLNLAIHELGHMFTYSASELTTSLMGSIAQVAVPALLAVFFFFRGDWVGAGLFLVWGATSALEVAMYVADAPTQKLDLIGGKHDWAFILGPEGYDAMGKSASLAETIRDGATVAMIAGVAMYLVAPLRGRRRDPQPEGTAATSRVTAA